MKKIFLGIFVLFFLIFVVSKFEFHNNILTFSPQAFERAGNQFYYTAQLYSPKAKPTVRLDLTFHRQEHTLSCEIAALKMALTYRGVSVSESELLKDLPFSDQGARHIDGTWGDPNLGFVGNIDGSALRQTGYGVYEKPLSNLGNRYRETKILENATLADLMRELDNGNPIVVWGVLGAGPDISWKTPEGKLIKAVRGEHARTLIGYVGPKENPTQLIIMDPIYGEIRWTKQVFLKDWAKLDNKALVVY